MKTVIVLLVAALFPWIALAKESCELKDLNLSDKSKAPEKLFYVGTCHFRNGDYSESAKRWKKLSELENVDSQYSDLQITSLNNLGFLYFFGQGVPVNKNDAMTYWKKAISLGNVESEYHLCHAYADKKEPTYDRNKALIHCKKAEQLYKGKENKSPAEQDVLLHVQQYLSLIE